MRQVQTYERKKMADSIISPSDGDTSEEEEYTRIMSTNNTQDVGCFIFCFEFCLLNENKVKCEFPLNSKV